MPIIKLLDALDIKSFNLNLYELIGFVEVINKYLLSCKAMFHKENNIFSEICSVRFSIIKASFVLNLKNISSLILLDSICKQAVLFFKIEDKCDLPDPEGP